MFLFKQLNFDDEKNLTEDNLQCASLLQLTLLYSSSFERHPADFWSSADAETQTVLSRDPNDSMQASKSSKS